MSSSQIHQHIIIGAGLSGLTAAYYLKKEHGITPFILEARDRLGGRIKTESSIDLGATWLGEQHQALITLLDELGVETFPQYQQGKGILVHSAVEPHHFFDAGGDDNATFRIAGGSARLINALKEQSGATVHSDQAVHTIRASGDYLELLTQSETYHAKKVAITLPPQLAAESITFTPALPAELQQMMTATPTWMSNAIKVGIAYRRPFWRDQNLAGTLIAPNGPIIELYDHSNRQESFYGLMGFVNEALRASPGRERKKAIIEFLSTCFGELANHYIAYTEKDWRSDKFVATDLTQSIYMHPDYGHEVWEKVYMDGKLLFCGSETSAAFGGYMEGAVHTGKKGTTFINE